MGSTNASAVYLGVDIGTSGCRCVAVDADGRTLAVAQTVLSLAHPCCPAGSSRMPTTGWPARSPRSPRSAPPVPSQPAAVRAIGVDGQSWACVPVDEAGRILANTPIWMDTRAQSICDEVLARVPAADILAVAGNRLSPSYTTAKVLWFQRNAAGRVRPHALVPAVQQRRRDGAHRRRIPGALAGLRPALHRRGHRGGGRWRSPPASVSIRTCFPTRCGAVGDRRRRHGGRGARDRGAARALRSWPVGWTPPAAPSAPASTGSARPRSRAARRAACRSPWTPRQPTNG